MARIRTVKPELFRHEKLQDLEAEHANLHPMLVFIGLFTQCDKNGVFEWRPRQLALDILPFVWKGSTGEALGKSLTLLRENDLVTHVEKDGKQYGIIPTFNKHQRISGKEKSDPARFPEASEFVEVSSREALGKQQGSTGEAPGKAGREGKGKGKDICPELPVGNSAPKAVVEILLNSKALYPLSQNDIDDWQSLFPAVDVVGELRKMAAWAEANPTRRKTDKGVRRFVVGWLSKEQDKGHRVPAVVSQAPTPQQDEEEKEWQQALSRT